MCLIRRCLKQIKLLFHTKSCCISSWLVSIEFYNIYLTCYVFLTVYGKVGKHRVSKPGFEHVEGCDWQPVVTGNMSVWVDALVVGT